MAAATLVVALAGLAPETATRQEHLVDIALLGVNDLHGQLVPAAREEAPGAARLAGALRDAEADFPRRALTVHAGDMVGASPLVSSHFGDEPTIEALNLMGVDAGTYGNHEFDAGVREAQRLARAASFPYVSANVVNSAGRPLGAPYHVIERAGVEIGIVGATTTDTPEWLLPRHSRRLRFRDISDSVDRVVPALRARGVEAIVVLAHAGGPMATDAPDRAEGEVIREAAQMSDAVDVVVAGHSHTELNEEVQNVEGDGAKLVVQAGSYGRAFARVKLTIDRRSGDVVATDAEIEPVPSALGADPEVARLVARHRRHVAPIARRVVGRTPEDLTRGEDGERGTLGTVVADAQRAFAGTDVSFVDQTNLRTDLDSGAVTFAEVARAHGYGSELMRFELRGAAIADLVERAWKGGEEPLYTSGLSYRTAPFWPLPGSLGRIELASGGVLDPDRTYSVVANELLATGHRFPAIGRHAGPLESIGSDRKALAAWLGR